MEKPNDPLNQHKVAGQMIEICLVTIDDVTRQAKNCDEFSHPTAIWVVDMPTLTAVAEELREAKAELQKFDEMFNGKANRIHFGDLLMKLKSAEPRIEKLRAAVEKCETQMTTKQTARERAAEFVDSNKCEVMDTNSAHIDTYLAGFAAALSSDEVMAMRGALEITIEDRENFKTIIRYATVATEAFDTFKAEVEGKV